jgi:phosphatidylserine/phosphatidylglycerophosphate/cardiolipin synthase-like enzyme
MLKLLLGRDFSPAVSASVSIAKKSIRVLAYDWRVYPIGRGSSVEKFNSAILSASARGVDVRVVANTDRLRSFFASSRVQFRKRPSARILHAKVIIVDDSVAFVGSHNLTKSAFALNHEVSVVFDDPLAVARLISYFSGLWVL